MTIVEDIIRKVESWSGHPLNADEGVLHGSGDRDVSAITICWMATPQAIEAAGQAGDDLLIGHESLYYPYDVLEAANKPEGWQKWKVNEQRRKHLEKYDLPFLRLHGSVDEICIFDCFASVLGLGEPVFARGLVKVYEIPECSLGELTKHVKDCLAMPSVRITPVTGMDARVKRVGLPWGGLGLFINVAYQQLLVEQDCDVFIAGETDNYGFRFAQECNIPMIETSHEISENPGLRHFTIMLASAFPEIRFRFYENGCVWRVI